MAAAKKAAKKTARRAPARKAARPVVGKAPAKKAAKKRAAGTKAPRAAKADGEAPVRAYFETLRPEHRAIGERIDAIIAKNVPNARRAIKWNSPFWGIEGKGWFASFASFKHHAKIAFFRGVDLKPAPPEGGSEFMRGLNIRSLAELDEKQITSWVKQAAVIPGWGK